MWHHSGGSNIQDGLKFHGPRQCLLYICWVRLLHDLQHWPAQTGHGVQCFLLVAPSLSLSEQLKLCLANCPPNSASLRWTEVPPTCQGDPVTDGGGGDCGRMIASSSGAGVYHRCIDCVLLPQQPKMRRDSPVLLA
ncbi:hypothetical protein E2C01_059533 [Portunus trituberculatus]|uniref:Uncharacterized protein n=1 Tax=Portunus trituberculatus TaxID=210409 RepID=A0A5B7H6B9_PORTR|nr:hypothetical protein [Portunus trituberculatus]